MQRTLCGVRRELGNAQDRVLQIVGRQLAAVERDRVILTAPVEQQRQPQPTRDREAVIREHAIHGGSGEHAGAIAQVVTDPR